EVLMPVGNLVKHEIVKLGVEIGAPLHLTWSCYEGGEKHCGMCGPCYMRKMAFRINGLEDPVEYES
nr:7-cyano-7-deazaguanine synthase [Stygiolobus sp.]